MRHGKDKWCPITPRWIAENECRICALGLQIKGTANYECSIKHVAVSLHDIHEDAQIVYRELKELEKQVRFPRK